MIEIQPIAGALGAEIHGVDLSQDLPGETVAEIRKAFLEHLVVFFRGQKLTPQQQLAFARRLGEPMEYPQLKGLPECPLITPVVKLEHEKVNFGGIWHSDTSYLERPPMASMLYALEVPPRGGDTLFANQTLAYETLSEGLKATLKDLVGINTSTKAAASRTREDRLKEAGAELKVLVGEHPVVRTHPETGRKALYVNPGFTVRIEGLPERESEALGQLRRRIHPIPRLPIDPRRAGCLRNWSHRWLGDRRSTLGRRLRLTRGLAADSKPRG